MDTSPNVATLFQRASVDYLRSTYLPRIARAVQLLPAEDLWWSPHEDTNAVGNLLLHLEGNVRQWIVSGIGGAPDDRQRALEFRPEERPALDTLMERLGATVEAACGVLEALPEARWLERCEIQGYDQTLLEAVYHVVEHFSWHTGQITTIAKQRAGARHGMAFYDEAAVNRARNPEPRA